MCSEEPHPNRRKRAEDPERERSKDRSDDAKDSADDAASGSRVVQRHGGIELHEGHVGDRHLARSGEDQTDDQLIGRRFRASGVEVETEVPPLRASRDLLEGPGIASVRVK